MGNLAQGVLLHHRTQTLGAGPVNLPIAPAAGTISSVAQSIHRNIADGLGRALDFDSILRADPQPGVAGSPADAEQLRAESADLIRQSLAEIGVDVNHGLQIDVQADGELRVPDDHPRAAEIELSLNGESAIRDALRQLASAVGETRLTILPA